MTQASQSIQRAPVPDETSAIAKLPPDLAIIKMENDNMIALAAKRPRNTQAIMAAIKDEFEACPELAQEAEYCKPVGRERKDGPMKFARGLSIRAAESLNAHYGYTRVRADVTPVDADTVKVEATFVDYQTGRIWQDNNLLSRHYTRRGGGQVRHSDDRFFSIVIPAEKSRRLREAILRAIPSGIKAEMLKMAHERLSMKLDEKTVQDIVDTFQAKGVSCGQVENALNKRQEDWDTGDRITLLGMWNAIQDGETTIEETFGKPDQKLAEEAMERRQSLKDKMRAQTSTGKTQAPPETATVPKDGAGEGAKGGEAAETPSSSTPPQGGGLFADQGAPLGPIEP